MSIEFEVMESEKIKGVYIIKPNKFKDLRGEIWSAFISKDLDILLPEGIKFIHDKFITSKHNVLRGIHGDANTYKLATCLYGEIEQVVVDCRVESPTYMQYEKIVINPENQLIVLLPPNMGNAHYVKSDLAIYYYKCAYNGEYTDADKQFTLAWNDSKIGINWSCKNPILSKRDLIVEA